MCNKLGVGPILVALCSGAKKLSIPKQFLVFMTEKIWLPYCPLPYMDKAKPSDGLCCMK